MNEYNYVSLAVLATIQEITGRVMRQFAGQDFAERSEKDLGAETAAMINKTVGAVDVQ
jgi:hypothetical protein